MNAKRCLLNVLCIASLLSAIAPAKADDLDEKQAVLQSKINQAAANKQLSSKDASELRKEMSKFDEKKNSTKAAHSDVLSIKDDKELDTMLSDISQHFEEKKKEVPAKK